MHDLLCSQVPSVAASAHLAGGARHVNVNVSVLTTLHVMLSMDRVSVHQDGILLSA